jgi:hypothetical protein
VHNRPKGDGGSVTGVTPAVSDGLTGENYLPTVAKGGRTVRDIHEVLRKKQAEQSQLGKQIEALQTAAEQLRSVAHLLDEEHGERDDAAGRG